MICAQKILSKISRKIAFAKNDLGNLWGGNDRFFKDARGARIVVYHGICGQDPLRYNNSFLTRATFEEHLQYYTRYFSVLSLDDYFHGRFDEDRFNVCITFDDGYANNYKYALPLLEKHKVPAAFFVTAVREAGYDILWNDFLAIVSKHGPAEMNYKGVLYRKGRYGRYTDPVDNTRLADRIRAEPGFEAKAQMMRTLSSLYSFRDDRQDDDFWQLLTDRQITEMARSPLVTIGAHGYYHNDLVKAGTGGEDGDRGTRDAAWEMTAVKRYLENLTGKEAEAIAFPYGAYDRSVRSAAKTCAFRQLLPLDFFFEEDHSDPAMRERFVVNPFISTTNQMIAIIKRTYAF